MKSIFVGEPGGVFGSDGDVRLAQNSEVVDTRSPNEFRKGRLVFQFPTADEEAKCNALIVCTCSGPCVVWAKEATGDAGAPALSV